MFRSETISAKSMREAFIIVT